MTRQILSRHQGDGMKVIIAGSRSIRDMAVLEEAIKLAGYEITEVVSGGAGGVDSLGEEWALNHRIPCRRFTVEGFEWARGKDAGHKRNERMAIYGEALIAVWDGKSTGTSDMVRRMKAHGKPHYVHRHEGETHGGASVQRTSHDR
jgi:hypothetical protein